MADRLGCALLTNPPPKFIDVSGSTRSTFKVLSEENLVGCLVCFGSELCEASCWWLEQERHGIVGIKFFWINKSAKLVVGRFWHLRKPSPIPGNDPVAVMFNLMHPFLALGRGQRGCWQAGG
jgi:hypothetical protein